MQTLNLMKRLKEKKHYVRFLGSCPTLLEKTKEIDVPSTKFYISDPPVTKFGAVSFLWKKGEMKKKLISKIESTPPVSWAEYSAPQGIKTTHEFDLDSGILTTDSVVKLGITVFMLSLTEKLLLTEWCVKEGIDVVWIEHDRVGRWLTKNPWLPKLRKLSRLVKTVVVSELSREIYVKLGWRPEDVVAIPNGIDMELFSAHGKVDRNPESGIRNSELSAIPRPGFRVPNSGFRIGCLSRLTYDKGVDLLIEAVNSTPNVLLTIVGTGKEEKNLKELARSSENRIKFTDHVDDLNDFYSSIDALILPSREHDPFGICVAEAMAAGVPTIITDVCGIASHLEGSESIIVKAGSADELRGAIEKIQRPEIWKRLAEVGPMVVKERFSVERMVEKYEEVIGGMGK